MNEQIKQLQETVQSLLTDFNHESGPLRGLRYEYDYDPLVIDSFSYNQSEGVVDAEYEGKPSVEAIEMYGSQINEYEYTVVPNSLVEQIQNVLDQLAELSTVEPSEEQIRKALTQPFVLAAIKEALSEGAAVLPEAAPQASAHGYTPPLSDSDNLAIG